MSYITAFQYSRKSVSNVPHIGTLRVRVGGDYYENSTFSEELFPFDVNGYLQYDPSCNLYSTQTKDKTRSVLTDAQIELCHTFNESLPDLLDLPLHCYDPKRDNLYMGMFPKSQIKNLGYVAVETAPSAGTPQLKKWDLALREYVLIHVVVLEDGNILFTPTSVCDRCSKFLSKVEWNATIAKTPELEGISETHVSPWIIYDLDMNELMDIRTPSAKLQATYDQLLDYLGTKESDARIKLFSTCEEFEYFTTGGISETVDYTSVIADLNTNDTELLQPVITPIELETINADYLTIQSVIIEQNSILQQKVIKCRSMMNFVFTKWNSLNPTDENLSEIYSILRAFIDTTFE